MFALTTRVLVLDDMMTMRKIVAKNLKELGFTDISEGEDGTVGWALLEKALAENKPIQLVLSDWNMPKLSGLDLLKKVRADNRFKDLPFVLITAESEKSQVIEAIKAQVSNYVVKPFTSKHLQEKLEATYSKIQVPKSA